MPVINNTPTKTLSACDAAQGALFTTTVLGCNLRIANGSPLAGITNIEYEISLGATVVQTINTTATLYDWEAASLYYGQTLSIKQTITSGVGTFEYTADVGIPSSLSSCVFEFSSNNGAADTFDPSVVNSASNNIYWRFPDDIVRTGATQSVLGSLAGFDGTTQDVRMHPVSFALVDEIDISGDKIVGYVDFTQFTAITKISAYSNTNFTSTNITNLTGLEDFRAYNSGLTGSFTNSGCTSMDTLHIYSCSGITNLTLEKSAPYVQIWANSTSIGGALDLSNITFGATTRLRFYSTDITSINTTGCSSTSVREFLAYNCSSLVGSVDLSPFTGTNMEIRFTNSPITSLSLPSGEIRTVLVGNTSLSATIDLSSNTLASSAAFQTFSTTIPSISLPSTGVNIVTIWTYSTGFGVFNFNSNTLDNAADVKMDNQALTAAETNENLVNMDAADSGSVASGSITIAGSNAAPDGTSGGFDGLTAKANLIAAGFTVTTT